jgi:hypothetical protein
MVPDCGFEGIEGRCRRFRKSWTGLPPRMRNAKTTTKISSHLSRLGRISTSVVCPLGFRRLIRKHGNLSNIRVAAWLTRRDYHGMADRATISTSFSVQGALPELVRSFSLLPVAYLVLRWLRYSWHLRQRSRTQSNARSCCKIFFVMH